ncbi:hypothetical protein T265_15187 [Opisthorchis viverrini]|uniref:Uncharacterized protein n=1 Tax=Opisthorchis viverrini TaxID=6198 RepID=A0A074ZCU0_OPIVI|nr:hypothetical protein T265_15187 [Opisthorchis viverrini]KER21010.1 hypothetical protein T265_15187 [Opisthorchis viverrini]
MTVHNLPKAGSTISALVDDVRIEGEVLCIDEPKKLVVIRCAAGRGTLVMASSSQSVVATAPVSAEGYTVDVTSLFASHLGSHLFSNVHELAHCIKQFERTSGSYYSVRNSKANSSGEKTFIKYPCHRKGFSRPPNEGKRRRLLDHT